MNEREISRLRQRKNLLFVNKKKQKNFVTWSAPAVVSVFQCIKVLCFFFSKKMLLPSLQPIDFTYCLSARPLTGGQCE